jgi:hypothetical protein
MGLREILWVVGIGFIWLRIGNCGGPCEHGNGLSGRIKGGEFFDLLSDYWLLEENSAPQST